MCEFTGEVLTAPEATLRASLYARVGLNYLMAVREHSGSSNSSSSNSNSSSSSSVTFIDPTYMGGVSRYLNHSCAPNLQV